MTGPMVSVIIPYRNAAATLAQTLESVIGQTFQDWEALLIDDASSDQSAAIAASYAAGDHRLRLLQHQDQMGAAAARNTGIRASSGRFIAFLDADDLWLPQKLDVQIPDLLAGAPLVFSGYDRINTDGAVLTQVIPPPKVGYRDMLAGNPIGCLTAVWDTIAFGRCEMPILPMHEDYAFWLNLLRSGAHGQGLPDVLARYRVSPQSQSGQKLRAARATWSILRSEPGMDIPRAALGFVRYATTALRRRI
jgi:teichuronic acid biosynthesis glycosyltransferase TuaG